MRAVAEMGEHMKKWKETIFKYPIIFTTTILVLAIILTELKIEKFFYGFLDKQGASYLTIFLEQGFVGLIILLIIAFLGIRMEAGFTKQGHWKQIWLVWPILLYFVLNGWSVFSGEASIDFSKPNILVLFLLKLLTIGFFEETLCRGLVTTLLMKKWGRTKKGIYFAVLTSSILFGVAHIINFIMGRTTLIMVITQMIYATCYGVFFSAYLLRTRLIWPLMIAHAGYNMCGDLAEIIKNGSFGQVESATVSQMISTIIILFPLFLYGLFILRKVEPNAIPEENNSYNTNFKDIQAE